MQGGYLRAVWWSGMLAPPRASTNTRLCFPLAMLYRITAICRVFPLSRVMGLGFLKGPQFLWVLVLVGAHSLWPNTWGRAVLLQVAVAEGGHDC